MALALYDRVQQTGTANTTVSFTLSGSVTGYQSFSVIGNGNTTYYGATDASGNWEAGIGTYSTTGPTLTRTTILSSSNSGSAVTFSGTVTVFVTYPSGKSVNLDASGNVSALGTVASGTWNGSTIPVAYGGTGVTASTGASSVVLRDASQNIVFNNYIAGYTATTAAAGTTVLTVASARNQILIGSTTQTFQLPNATTLALGQSFVFLNNSSGVLTVKDNASTTIDTVPSGAVVQIGATSIATSAGSWSAYSFLPGSYDFNSTTATFNNATISSAVWNGTTIASGYGGTGLTTFTAANNALYSTSASALAAGTLPVAAGGTGVTSSTGTGSVVLSTSPTLVTPALGTPSALVGTNITGTASGLSIGGNAATATSATSATTATTATTANALNTANNYQVSSLGVGTAANGTAGDITASRAGGTTGVIFFGTSGARYLYYDGSSYYLPTASLLVGGNVTAYYSDERLKTKLGNIENPLDKVCSLEGFVYTENDLAKSFGYNSSKKQVALSAQQVQKVQPEAVSLAPFDTQYDKETNTQISKSGKNYLTVDYGRLVPLLVEAIKELKAEIAELKAK